MRIKIYTTKTIQQKQQPAQEYFALQKAVLPTHCDCAAFAMRQIASCTKDCTFCNNTVRSERDVCDALRL